MVKISVFIGTSLDGFIAREDGDIGWLNNANKKVTSGEDFGFNNF
jgi:dihydrofolate reductase